MTVNVQCPSCGKAYNVKDESIGARANCKSCGATFTLSISMDDTGKSSSKDADSDQASDKEAAERSSHTKSSAGKAKEQRSSSGLAGKTDREKVPKKLGNYVVQRKLGAGAMGVVYLGRDPVLDRQVAIKVLPAVFSSDKERLKRFLREAKSAARLHHTNVAAVHQAGAEGRLAYIAMEYVEGTSLDKAVPEGKPMDWREATRVIRDAAAGLGAAHAIDLVHRDIKPGNLIQTKDGVTKVVDFGLARGQQTDTQLTQQGTLLGTPAYMAPEQWMGGEVDGRTDLYSLICTYYYLLTGQLPFDAPSLPALGYQHRYEAFPDPREHVPDLPDGICRILAHGSAKEPAERFQDADELVSQLEVLLACPEESLTFGSSWEELDAAAGSELSPLEEPLSDGFADLEASAAALPTPKPSPAKPSPAPAWKLQVPLWVWVATAGFAALVVFGVVIILSMKYGTVQITVHNADENVRITVDGDTIAVDGLNEPLKLKVGEHNLVASSPNFETVTQSFQVKEDETTVLEVTFVPKAMPETVVEAATSPATYRVTLDPPQATLAASGEGVSVSGQGGERTVNVSEPDGQSKIVFVATLDGYHDYRQELQPAAGELKHLIIRLEQIPKPSPTPQVSESPEKKTTMQEKAEQTLAKTLPPTANQPVLPGGTPKPSLLVAPFDAQAAQQAQQRWAEYLKTEATVTNSIGMKLKLIPAGEFTMGSAKSPQEIVRLFDLDEGKANYFTDEHPQHKVRITKSLFLGVTEVTQSQWEAVMKTRPWSGQEDVREGADHPASYVSWEDAKTFCDRLGKKEGVTYRLPTEAESEYACRAGTTTEYNFGEDRSRLDDYAWCHWKVDAVVEKYAHCVGQKRPNSFGLYDMHGNVAEWCQDWYGADYYAESPPHDPPGPDRGSFRVFRGGCWGNDAWNCRSARRHRPGPTHRLSTMGFRVAMTVADATGAIGQGLISPLPEGTLAEQVAEFHKRWEVNRESLEKASQLYGHEGPEVRRLERQKEALSSQAVELAKRAKAEVDLAEELRDSLIAQGRAEDSPLVRGAEEELQAKSELLGSLGYCLPRQFRERMFGKSGIVPPGLEATFIVSVSGYDQHRNPVHARNGSLFDLETGWSFEIWLKEPRMELVFIPAGEFTMGSTFRQPGGGPYRADETPAHRVRITKPFYISKYEVTEAQWQGVVSSRPSPTTKSGAAGQYPAGDTSWQDWQTFCGKLNQKTRLKGFRLPTEAEWEYACRAGTTTLFFFGDDPTALKHYAQHGSFETPRGKGGPRPVGLKRPNGWGLYDVYGNMSEWCQDWSGPYQSGLQIDPIGPGSGPGRVNRGGQGWLLGTEACNSSYRHWNRANRYVTTGARIVLSVP